jgi:hypothetical protein
MDTTALATASVKDDRILHAIAEHRDSFQVAVDRSALWRLAWVKFKILNGPAATELRRRMTSPSKPDLCLSCAQQVNENATIDRILGRGAVAAEA